MAVRSPLPNPLPIMFVYICECTEADYEGRGQDI